MVGNFEADPTACVKRENSRFLVGFLGGLLVERGLAVVDWRTDYYRVHRLGFFKVIGLILFEELGHLLVLLIRRSLNNSSHWNSISKSRILLSPHQNRRITAQITIIQNTCSIPLINSTNHTHTHIISTSIISHHLLLFP